MPGELKSIEGFIAALVPLLSRSLAEEFNVFRVMHHGTHEKQLSNVFAWLLDPDATHGLQDAFPRIFMDRVNAGLPAERRLPVAGYRVLQEVDTRGTDGASGGDMSKDIADIVLSRPDAAVVVENFVTSDGHGHDFARYLAHAVGDGRSAAVVLLCHLREAHLQRDGWQQAVVVTYGEVLGDLHDYIDKQPAWRRQHREQLFFVRQMIQHFVKGPAAVDVDDQLAFIEAMCQTGESARYGQRPRERMAQEFADLVAEHARRQFDDSLKTLAQVKHRLRDYAKSPLAEQVNAELPEGMVEGIEARFVGQWEWCVTLQRADGYPYVFLEFGPTAVVEVSRAPVPLAEPDYSEVFVTRRAPSDTGIDYVAQTGVTLREVLRGLPADDHRLRDAVLGAIGRD